MRRTLAVLTLTLTVAACGGDDDGNGDGGGTRTLSDSLEDRFTLTEIEKNVDFDYSRKYGVTVKEVACVPESDRKATCHVEFREPDLQGREEAVIELTWDGTEYVWQEQ
jgi:hypothetical protein